MQESRTRWKCRSVAIFQSAAAISSVVTKPDYDDLRDKGAGKGNSQLQATAIAVSHAIVENFQLFSAALAARYPLLVTDSVTQGPNSQNCSGSNWPGSNSP